MSGSERLIVGPDVWRWCDVPQRSDVAQAVSPPLIEQAQLECTQCGEVIAGPYGEVDKHVVEGNCEWRVADLYGRDDEPARACHHGEWREPQCLAAVTLTAARGGAARHYDGTGQVQHGLPCRRIARAEEPAGQCLVGEDDAGGTRIGVSPLVVRAEECNAVASAGQGSQETEQV